MKAKKRFIISEKFEDAELTVYECLADNKQEAWEMFIGTLKIEELDDE